jgi:hypothetical protein
MGLRAKPNRFNSIAAAHIKNDLPLPTTWASRQLGVCKMRHTPAFWRNFQWVLRPETGFAPYFSRVLRAW